MKKPKPRKPDVAEKLVATIQNYSPTAIRNTRAALERIRKVAVMAAFEIGVRQGVECGEQHDRSCKMCRERCAELFALIKGKP